MKNKKDIFINQNQVNTSYIIIFKLEKIFYNEKNFGVCLK